MLHCSELTLSVPGRTLCSGLDLVLEAGQIWAVLGRNGSGKTTLIHALAGLRPRERGSVRIDGRPLEESDSPGRARAIGVLPQIEDAEYWGTVIDYVLLGRFPHSRSWFGWRQEDEAAARMALDAVDLAPLAARAYASLSGGERQRARIAQLLAQGPRVFLLDEPLQHLDLRHQVDTLRLFRRLALESGRAVAMVLHDTLWPGRFCTHALFMDGGTARAGPVEDMLTRVNLEVLYGCSLEEFGRNGSRHFLPHV